MPPSRTGEGVSATATATQAVERPTNGCLCHIVFLIGVYLGHRMVLNREYSAGRRGVVAVARGYYECPRNTVGQARTMSVGWFFRAPSPRLGRGEIDRSTCMRGRSRDLMNARFVCKNEPAVRAAIIWECTNLQPDQEQDFSSAGQMQ